MTVYAGIGRDKDCDDVVRRDWPGQGDMTEQSTDQGPGSQHVSKDLLKFVGLQTLSVQNSGVMSALYSAFGLAGRFSSYVC